MELSSSGNACGRLAFGLAGVQSADPDPGGECRRLEKPEERAGSGWR